jgi:hypothetical protein
MRATVSMVVRAGPVTGGDVVAALAAGDARTVASAVINAANACA